MNIIIEGPDNSGKSTLIEFLAPRLAFGVHRGEGPPRDAYEWAQRLLRTAHLNHVIFDRHPAVSEPIYGPICRGVDFSDYAPDLLRSFYSMPHLFVYCVGQGYKGHVADHERDTPEHLSKIEQRYSDICAAYDRWAIRHANIIYRMGDSKSRVARQLIASLHTGATITGRPPVSIVKRRG